MPWSTVTNGMFAFVKKCQCLNFKGLLILHGSMDSKISYSSLISQKLLPSRDVCLCLQVVAVKQLDKDGLQGNREFLVEVLMLSLLHHPNLVNLIGYCASGDQRLLVYEYMALGSLEDHLLGTVAFLLILCLFFVYFPSFMNLLVCYWYSFSNLQFVGSIITQQSCLVSLFDPVVSTVYYVNLAIDCHPCGPCPGLGSSLHSSACVSLLLVNDWIKVFHNQPRFNLPISLSSNITELQKWQSMPCIQFKFKLVESYMILWI